MPPAARVTDMHTCPMVTALVPHVGGPVVPPCCPTVLTCGMPQARVTDICTCVGPPDVIVKGSASVFVGGLPAARIGDMTAHGGVIVTGCPTVIIGDASSGGGGAGGGAAAMATGDLSPLLSSGPGLPGTQAQAKTLIDAAKNGTPFCERCAKG